MTQSDSWTAALVHCPNCGSAEIEPVSDGDRLNFLCRACFRCWHAELGAVHRVDPETCPGCRYRDICTAMFAGSDEG